jgi:aminoacrylate hydrolase
MPHLTLADGDQLYYEAQGSGPPLLLITGVYGLASFWPRALVDRLAEQYTVILHDQRGTGQSSRSRILYSLAQMCGDVLHLCDGLGIQRAHIVGHSLGGAIAQTIALDHPERIDRLILSATWAGPDPYFQGLIGLRRDMLARGDWDLYARFGALLMHPSPWVREHAAERLGPALPAVPDSVSRAIMVERLQVVLAHDRRAELGRVTAVTLVVGARDDIWTPAYLSVELGRLIPDAEILILPEGQHFFPQVVPKRFAGILHAFLARTPTPAIRPTSVSGPRTQAP